mmetsp:Transcript_565/g.787  ORF Transcript_565/g.787 Transcript_565/m.787 type:complete len:131 (+) Transcript_565:363-755(+)
MRKIILPILPWILLCALGDQTTYILLDTTIGVGQPKKIENAKILLANTSMDTDKIKIYGSGGSTAPTTTRHGQRVRRLQQDEHQDKRDNHYRQASLPNVLKSHVTPQPNDWYCHPSSIRSFLDHGNIRPM